MERRPSPNFDARTTGTPIDMLVLHYTGMESADAALDRLCDPEVKVSAHYVIDEDGSVLQLVDEGERAWHAGEAYWRGHTDINARSVGIELVNPGHEFGLCPYPEAQMQALLELARDVVSRHGIPARNVVGHSDVAPRRKTDPGELFDWQRLHEAGLGLWPGEPEPCEMAEAGTLSLLQDIGYETVDPSMTIAAFQRRFRPSRIDGKLDAETAGLLDRLAALLG